MTAPMSAPTREGTRVADSPIERPRPFKNVPSVHGQTDGQTDAGTCPADMSCFREQVGQVINDIKSGKVVRIYQERTRHGLAWVLPVEHAPTRAPNKTAQAVRWMIENDQLSRRPFFRACPWANNSVSLHDRALKRIAKAKLSEKIAGVWVLKDHEAALAWLKTKGVE